MILIQDISNPLEIHLEIHKFIDYIKKNHRLDLVYSYFKGNNLNRFIKKDYKFQHPTQYVYVIYNILKDKYYIGETLDCFSRLKNYFDKRSISNCELQDDLTYNDMLNFKYWLIPTDDCVYLERKKIQDALYTGKKIYNTIQASPFTARKKEKRISNTTFRKAAQIDKENGFRGFEI